MSNLYTQFKKLLPNAPLQVGDVTAYADGVATVEIEGGGLVLARGTASVSDRVFVRDGLIEGIAPTLSLVTVTI